ncbi:glycosyltransferase [Flavimarina sp. Hel_I_48]|uniref:glycosyltransferase family protein n=1 Tax=Flavimarina sp. Hel_I_48 TaxID=1392488 RepID=UPI0004DF849C|nr:glycosyltransferase [Flavimarina sp. Hel_I_48]
MKKLLKFDIIHPPEYLQKKIAEWDDLEELSLAQYRERLINLRSNYSDYYTYHLNETGAWKAEEFFLLDKVYLEKVARETLGTGRFLLKLKSKIAAKFFRKYDYYRDQVIDSYIKKFNPDVIFVRSQPIPSAFWQRYRHNTLLVSRLSARLPKLWHPNDWDLIYTDQPDFQRFFQLHGTDTIINDQGFDIRVPTELENREKKYDCSFVGGLGTQNFTERTEFIHAIASKTDFKWWGYWWKYGGDGRKLKDFPFLHKTYQGYTSGLEMYQTFLDSKISLNDYVDTANGIGFNQRMFEVMGVGGFLLTRWAPNFESTFPAGIFATYTDEKDCLKKIAYYLANEQEREKIAAAGKKFIAENYDYTRITASFANDLNKRLS